MLTLMLQSNAKFVATEALKLSIAGVWGQVPLQMPRRVKWTLWSGNPVVE